VPVEVSSLVVKVKIDVALPSVGTATGLCKANVTPFGATPDQAAERLIDELNPFSDENTMDVDRDWDGVRVTTAGLG